MTSPMQMELQDPKNFRQFLNEDFSEIKQSGSNILSFSSNVSGVFDRITSPNEFAGPLIEAWSHIHLSRILDNYKPAKAGAQEFADARAEYQGQPIFLNIKAKERGMAARSRINLSSFQRYNTHYSQPSPSAFYVLVFEYEWRPRGNMLEIVVERLKYAFNLLEIPVANYKIEGAFEGSYRIFISPIPKSAETASVDRPMITPAQFLQRIENLRKEHVARKTSRVRN